MNLGPPTRGSNKVARSKEQDRMLRNFNFDLHFSVTFPLSRVWVGGFAGFQHCYSRMTEIRFRFRFLKDRSTYHFGSVGKAIPTVPVSASGWVAGQCC